MTAAIERLLAEHESVATGCECGADCGWTHGEWQAHVAQVLAAHIEAEKAAALREAADHLPSYSGVHDRYTTWLRDRADRLAGEQR